MKGRYPVCCLFLEIDPAAVDVNIHPAKREVKFHRESEVRKLVAQAIRETLLAFHGGESDAPTVHSPKSHDAEQAELRPAPEISTPTLPAFPEKWMPPAEPSDARSTASALNMGFTPPLTPVPLSETGHRPSENSNPPSQPETIPHVAIPAAPERGGGARAPQSSDRYAAAQRPAPARRRHRQALRRAGIRPRTGAAGPARRARADFVRADDQPAGKERIRALAKTAAAGNHRTAAARRAVFCGDSLPR